MEETWYDRQFNTIGKKYNLKNSDEIEDPDDLKTHLEVIGGIDLDNLDFDLDSLDETDKVGGCDECGGFLQKQNNAKVIIVGSSDKYGKSDNKASDKLLKTSEKDRNIYNRLSASTISESLSRLSSVDDDDDYHKENGKPEKIDDLENFIE
jgi:hypothetical protein